MDKYQLITTGRLRAELDKKHFWKLGLKCSNSIHLGFLKILMCINFNSLELIESQWTSSYLIYKFIQFACVLDKVSNVFTWNLTWPVSSLLNIKIIEEGQAKASTRTSWTSILGQHFSNWKFSFADSFQTC